MLKSIFTLALATFLLTPFAQAEDASSDAMIMELNALAKDFAAIIDKKGGGAVAIGEFSASSDIKASVGPQIQLVLAKAFQTLKVPINSEDYRFEIKGDYQPLVDKETSLLGVKLVGRLIDRETAEPLAERPTGRFVFGAQSVPAMLGLNVSLKPTVEAELLSKEFERARKNPSANIQQTIVRSAASSPFALEILVKSNGSYTPRSIETDAKGRPLVPIKNSEVYGVRLINKAPFEVAVDLRIDGINIFEFSETDSKFYIVGPGKQVDVLGWHKSSKSTIEFKVVDFPDTAASKLNLKPSLSIGLITACFSASWAKDNERPSDEPELKGRGTGFGKEIEFKTEKVSRTIGQARDTISVRYER